ncbi:hypothetical protein CYMTET_13142 [Cymbomonas tetramitiformis]|uniref:Uncharacterized protein n=1 Tax=Cymbomonas tetramitiformis TaxID=36881 RepID=A0AAE0GJ29_9CHLO|nr:hypothetical protein CYMTET_13142 [Cymbomonas tetramitiformis]
MCPGQFAHVPGFMPMWALFVQDIIKAAKEKEDKESCITLCCHPNHVEMSFEKINKRLVRKWKSEFAVSGITMSDYNLSDFYLYSAGLKAGLKYFVVIGILLEGTSIPPPPSILPGAGPVLQAPNQQQLALQPTSFAATLPPGVVLQTPNQQQLALQPRSFAATLPPGVVPGQHLMTTAPDGTQVEVLCPEGVLPGGIFLVPY